MKKAQRGMNENHLWLKLSEKDVWVPGSLVPRVNVMFPYTHLLPLISFLDVFNDASSSFDDMASSVRMIKKAVKESCCGTLLSICL
jgi:hypothetical protein